ncbi:MAG: adenylosuccinate synthase [Gemmataceae bacterium]
MVGHSTCVVGLQWGDEAKGKVVDLLTDHHDLVVRYNGGANAGHTVVRSGKAYKLSLLPTGVLTPHVTSVIGNGVVVYPPRFREEVESLRASGIEVDTNLVVSNHAHVIFPYHMEEDRLNESSKDGAIGTTGRGIGPCYQDKLGRVGGIRVGDLLDPAALREKLRFVVPRKNRLLQALANAGEVRRFEADELADEYAAHGAYLRSHIADTTHLLLKASQAGKRILFEAAQGCLLDVDLGSYPYVTSSNSTPAGVWSGSGLSSRHLTRVIGVLKAYTTRVGRGPFPTELHDETGERIRRIGREYGTVTGRPRRVGWFDAVAARYSAAVAGVDELTLMLLDVLSGLPELAICTRYRFQGKETDEFPADAATLERCEPVLESLPGWTEDLTGARRRSDLPAAARRYVDRIESLVGRPVFLLSVGPDREQTILD